MFMSNVLAIMFWHLFGKKFKQTINQGQYKKSASRVLYGHPSIKTKSYNVSISNSIVIYKLHVLMHRLTNI